MPIRDNQRKLEKRLESLVVNQQFSESVGELVLDPDVHHHISDFFSEIWKIGEVISFIEILWLTIQNFT